MPTASYTARVYSALTKSSVATWGTLTASVRLQLMQFAEVQIFQPLGQAPTGAPWVGTVPLAANGEVNYGFVHLLANTLVADWNTKYDLELAGGSAGSTEGSMPRQTTLRYIWVDGRRVAIPNYSLAVEEPPGDVFDPFAGAPGNPGIRGSLRLEVLLTMQAGE